MNASDDDCRPWHWLPRNTRASVPTQVIAVDVEAEIEEGDSPAWGQRHKFRLGVALRTRLQGRSPTREKLLHFSTPRIFWDWLKCQLSRHRRTVVFGHRLGYDLVLLGFLKLLDTGEFWCWQDGDYKPNPPRRLFRKAGTWRGLFCSEEPPTVIVAKCDRGKVEFVDTYNYFQTSLKELGEWIGRPKGEWPGNHADTTDLAAYCENDCRIVRDVVLHLLDWWKSRDLGEWKPTPAALAFQAYRHKFLKERILITGSRKVCDLERRAYFGGLVYPFYVGKVEAPHDKTSRPAGRGRRAAAQGPTGPVYVLDYTAFYPWLMRDRAFPVRLAGRREDVDVKELTSPESRYYRIAEVTVNTTELLPFRDDKGKPHFALGQFQTVLCEPELASALDRGEVERVHVCQWYEKQTIFREFVDYFWRERQDAARAGEALWVAFIKALMVGLPGKFGQVQASWEDVPEVSPPFRWGAFGYCANGKPSPNAWRAVAGRAQENRRGGETMDSHPAIAAAVTSLGREWMKGRLAELPPRYVFYVACDGLHCTGAAYRYFRGAGCLAPGCLGGLGLKYTARQAEYRAANCYQLDGRWVIGGYGREKELVGEGEWREMVWERLNAVLARGLDDHVFVREEVKHLPPVKVDGAIGADGWVTPLTLGGNDEPVSCEGPSPVRRGGDSEGHPLQRHRRSQTRRQRDCGRFA